MCFLWASNGSYWYPFRNRSTQTRAQTQQTSPRGSNISLFKTSLREEPWNTTHQQPRRVLQEALHVATSGKSWLGSREKIFYLEDPRGASALRAWNLSFILLRIGARHRHIPLRKIFCFNWKKLVRNTFTNTSCVIRILVTVCFIPLFCLPSENLFRAVAAVELTTVIIIPHAEKYALFTVGSHMLYK